MYAGKGLNRDSNEAYRKAKLNELKFYKLSLEQDNLSRKERRRLRRSIAKIRFIQCLGFGYKWLATVAWIAGIILFCSIIGWLVSEVTIIDGLVASLKNSLSLNDGFIKMASFLVAFFESAVCILLIGFLGFIIANNVRNNN